MDSSQFNIPCLNGIRTISILIVFAAHAGAQNIVPGGFGVTVFFFLSGYLITTLLFREFDKNGTISIQNFYIRRIFRILPPFYAALLFAYALNYASILPGEATIKGGLLLALHAGNYGHIFWPELSIPPGTVVYWSLAVEEHFYLVFPLALALLLKVKNKSTITITLSLSVIAILIWRYYLAFQNVSEDRTYMASDTRIDSILYGCILAIAKNPMANNSKKPSKTLRLTIISLSIFTLVFCFLYRDPFFRETLRYSLQGIALMPLFYFAINESNSPLFNWLNWGPIDYIGKLSYTIYLTHYVIIYALKSQLDYPPILTNTLAGVACLALASASFHYFESPIGNLRKRYRS